jgi:phosphoribosylanthranilate isomerase
MESSHRGLFVTTRIKFCGITRAQDARFAIDLGIDAIGLVFTRRSQRFLGISQGREIRRMLPPFMTAVALFMDDEPSWIEEVISSVQPDVLQFHGAEAGPFATSFSRPYVKAVPMATVEDAVAYVALHPGASGFLLDSHALGALGGSGETFDWKRAPRIGKPTILAGGLDASNVAQAIALVRPYAVDVSSGIETTSGLKDATKMRRFVEAVRAADASLPK